MADKRDSDEIRDRYVEAMGAELGGLHAALKDALAAAYQEWLEYLALFGESDERLALLRRTAGQFFGMLQRVFGADLLLRVARLTDPEKSAGHNTATVRRYPLLVDGAMRDSLEPLVEDAVDKAEFARPYRNRLLAHLDLRDVLGDHPDPFPSRSREQVTEALDALATVLNEVEYHYLNGTTSYANPILSTGAEALVYHLERSVQAIDEEMEAARPPQTGAGKSRCPRWLHRWLATTRGAGV